MKIRLTKVITLTSLFVGAMYAGNAFAVTADDVICDGCVGRVDIGPNEVRTGHIKSYQIASWHLKAGVVKTIKIADGAVNSAKVLDNSLTASDLAPGSVGASELAPNSVYSVDIVDGQVTAADIASGAVGGSELATNAVSSSKILDGSVTAADLGTNSVGAAEIATGAVGSSEIADGSVTGTDIANLTITNADISNSAAISVSKISGSTGIEYNLIGSCLGIAVDPAVTSCGSISVTVPRAGYIFLSLDGTAITFGGGTTARIGIGTSNTTFNVNSVRVGVLDGTDSLRREFSPSASGVYYAARSGVYTFYANAYRPSVFSAKSVNLADLNLTAVFVPKRY